jgi:hypothetical protein
MNARSTDWENSARGQKAEWYEDTKSGIENNTNLIRMTMKEARDIKQLGDVDEALRFLKIGGDVIQEFTPGLLCLLKEMLKFSRMVSAMAPVSPLLPSRFHLAEMNNLAMLNQMLHQVVVSAKQRRPAEAAHHCNGSQDHEWLFDDQNSPGLDRRFSTEQEWEEIVNAGQDFQQLDHGIRGELQKSHGRPCRVGWPVNLPKTLRMRPSPPSLPTTSAKSSDLLCAALSSGACC